MILLALTAALPWALLAVLWLRRDLGLWLPLASLPALGAALLPQTSLEARWLLLDLQLATDRLNQPFLLLLGIAWSLAGWFAATRIREHPGRFQCFWLLTLAGITLAFLAQDMGSFYAGYAIMTLAGYGLVVHEQTANAWRAGRVYLILGLLGEGALLTGLFLIAGQFGNLPLADLGPAVGSGRVGPAGLFLLLGFGIKMGMLPLHVWLPLAHPAAPVPASAILSGVIVKAGLLGWLRLVPPELFSAPGPVLAWLGLAGAFYGALVGLTQRKPKAILAWSTVSQLGLLLALFGLMLWLPNTRPLLLPVFGLWALHHGLNKAALFLVVGSGPIVGRVRTLLFVLPALAIAGAPLTSGALAKGEAKEVLKDAAGSGVIYQFFSLTSITTSLLLLHLWRQAREPAGRDVSPPHPALPLMVIAGLTVPGLWWGLTQTAPGLAADALWANSWPLLLAAATAFAWQQWHKRPVMPWPADDWLALIRHAQPRLPRLHAPNAAEATWPQLQRLGQQSTHWLSRCERLLRGMPLVGASLLLLTLLIWLGG